MKELLNTLSMTALLYSGLQAQNMVLPATKGYGGVIEVPFETLSSGTDTELPIRIGNQR